MQQGTSRPLASVYHVPWVTRLVSNRVMISLPAEHACIKETMQSGSYHVHTQIIVNRDRSNLVLEFDIHALIQPHVLNGPRSELLTNFLNKSSL